MNTELKPWTTFKRDRNEIGTVRVIVGLRVSIPKHLAGLDDVARQIWARRQAQRILETGILQHLPTTAYQLGRQTPSGKERNAWCRWLGSCRPEDLLAAALETLPSYVTEGD